jgi:hypothetical protein
MIERRGLPVPEEEPEWQAVNRLMVASYERWQAEKNRTRAAELKAQIARDEIVDPKSLRGVRQHVMQLMQDGRYGDAITKLRETIPQDDGEWADWQSLLGRAYKEIFIQSRRHPADADLDPEVAVRYAINAYRLAYEKAESKIWPGVNMLALTFLAQESGYQNLVHIETSSLTQQLLDEMDRVPLSQRDNWYQATMLQLRLATDDWDAAERHLHAFIEDTRTTALALHSTMQEIADIWRLDQEGERGQGFVNAMRAALIAMPGGHFDMSGEDVERTLSKPDPAGDRLESMLGADGLTTYDWYRKGLAIARSVGIVSDDEGKRCSTAFLVASGDLSPALNGETLLLTPAHVADGSHVSFEADDNKRKYALAGRAWASQRHDACLWCLRPIPDIPPLPLARDLPVVSTSTRPRVYLIGYPGGPGLPFSFQDNELVDHEGPPDGNPPDPAVVRLQYQAPAEPGSAGSPVFDAPLWRVIAVHRAGGSSILRLNGRAETWQANEGTWIQSIVQAVRRDLATQVQPSEPRQAKKERGSRRVGERPKLNDAANAPIISDA